MFYNFEGDDTKIKEILLLHQYYINDFIGKGSYSRVYKVQSLQYSQNFVAKVIINKDHSIESNYKSFSAEIDALIRLDHPNIIRFYDYFYEKDYFFLILESCENGNLYDLIKKSKNISQTQIIEYFYQILNAIDYCHENKISHLDIKPQNILISKYNKIKIADFGLSVIIKNQQKIELFQGSFHYQAPEILLKNIYNPFKADIWSLGITFYFMLTKNTPWQNETDHELIKQQIISGLFQIPYILNENITDIIKEMLLLNPNLRPNIKEILKKNLFKKFIK